MRHENGFLSIITQLKFRKANNFPFQLESAITSENGVLSFITQLRKARKFPSQQESSIHSLTVIGNISTCHERLPPLQNYFLQ